MRNFFTGVIVGIFIPLFCVIIFIGTGNMPVATQSSPLPLERLVAEVSIQMAMGKENKKPSPVLADEVNLLAGVKIYQNQCAVCHGTMGGERNFIAKGLSHGHRNCSSLITASAMIPLVNRFGR